MKKVLRHPLVIITVCCMIFMLGFSLGHYSTYSVTKLIENDDDTVAKETDSDERKDHASLDHDQTKIININTADVQTLCFMPGIGEVLAKRIVDYRTEHGPFRTVEDLLCVNGIGEKTVQEISKYITFE